MSTTNERILSRLRKAEAPSRKTLSLSFKTEDLQKLDTIAKVMTKVSGRTTSRNMLIEEAIESYIAEAILTFAEENIDLAIADEDSFDTVIFPAQMGEEYRRAFFEDLEWRYVRIAKNRIPYIKYIALYVGTPQSAICHYAKVAPGGFIYVESEGKYKIRLDGDPIPLPHPIPLGSASPMAVRSPKYTTVQKLFSANEFRELYTEEVS